MTKTMEIMEDFDLYNTMTLFKRKVLQGVVSLEDMIKENERRAYEYLQ